MTAGSHPEIEAALDIAASDEAPALFDEGRARAQLDELFKKFDLVRELKRLAFGGFDSWDDYVKYGDLFVELSRSPAAVTR